MTGVPSIEKLQTQKTYKFYKFTGANLQNLLLFYYALNQKHTIMLALMA